MAVSRRTATIIVIVVTTIFVAANLANAINKAGDFEAYHEAGRRLLADRPLYEGSAIASGFVGPPAQALLFVPLAGWDVVVSRLFWFALNLALLGYAVTTWCGLLGPQASAASSRDAASDEPAWRRGARLLTTRWPALSLLAIAYPLQTQFEHQNLNVVLLALAAYSADALLRHRPGAAGAVIGIAAALKIYPVLALVWLAARRQWRAVATGVAAAGALTVAPALLRGWQGFMTDVVDFQALTSSGWPTRRASQSLVAMWGRYLIGESPDGYETLTLAQPLVLSLVVGTALLVILPLAIVAWRRAPSTSALVEELACVGGLAILLSPIAWEHYWVGFLPLFLVLATHAAGARTSWQSRSARIAFWIGLIGITVLSRPIVGWHGARAVRAWSVMTWAGLIMCVALAVILASRVREDTDRRVVH